VTPRQRFRPFSRGEFSSRSRGIPPDSDPERPAQTPSPSVVFRPCRGRQIYIPTKVLKSQAPPQKKFGCRPDCCKVGTEQPAAENAGRPIFVIVDNGRNPSPDIPPSADEPELVPADYHDEEAE
jgi:hypothetical protein